MVATDHRANRVAPQIPAHPRTHALDALDFDHFFAVGLIQRAGQALREALEIAELFKTHQVLSGAAEILDGDLTQVQRLHRAAQIIGGGGMGDPQLHHRAAIEIDSVVEALEDEQQDRRDIDRGRQQHKKLPLADKIDVNVGPESAVMTSHLVAPQLGP